MKKRILSLFLVLCLVSALLVSLPITASAATSGTCGKNLTWTLDSSGTLTISGTGRMDDFNPNSDNYGGSSYHPPWYYGYRSDIKSLIICNGITYIGNFAFFECDHLTSVTIPNSVTSMGYSVFYNCYSLNSVIIPNSVTFINNNTFYFCNKLSSVTIPSSVKSIGRGAFSNCSRLTSITIPSGVTSIDNIAFSSCYNLTSITIPRSVTTIGQSAFISCNHITDVYYTGSKKEWRNISMGNYNHSLTIATIHYNSSSSGNNVIVKSDFATITYNGVFYNLLTQPINIDKESGAEVSVKVNYKNITEDEKIYLSQNTENFVELENNVEKNIKPAEIFDTDKDIYVLIINEKTGASYSERTHLKIVGKTNNGELMPNGDIEGLNFKLGNEKSLTIPNTVPVFGGTEVKWDFGLIPISVEYDREDDNKINVVFGTNIAHSDGKKDSDKYFKDFSFKEYKEEFKDLTKRGRTLKQFRNDFKMSNAYKMNLFGDKVLGGGTGKPSFDFDIAGYAEAKIINGKFTFVEGQLCLEAEVSYTYQGQLFIWVVPLYYEIGGGVGADLEGDIINIDPNGYVPEFEAYLTAKIKAEIGAGLGVAKVATVGVSGEGTLNLKSALHKDYSKAWAEGKADFNVKVLGKEVAKKVFAKGDFLIYETGNANGLIPDSAVTPLTVQNALYSQIDIKSVYENENRAYASASTEWYGDMPQISLFDAEYTSKNLRLLAENVYTESAPIMCDIGGQKVMVMLWDNSERDAINRTMLVYSFYDDSEGVWSAPRPVCDDGTADFYPNFNDGYLVWQNEKSLLDDSMSLSDIAKLGEICVSKWNGNGFDTPVVLTNNDTLDTQPVVCASESEVSVIWTTNSENDILGLSGDNSVLKSSYENSAWSNPEVIKAGLGAITSLSAEYADGKLNVAYVEDEDNDLETIDDRDISIISESGEYKLTDNDVLDSNPQIKGDKIYYYSDGNIEYRVLGSEETNTVFADAKAGLTDNFAVSVSSNGDAVILWAKSVDGATEIFSTMCKDGKWSDEIQISETGNRSKYPTAVLDEDGTVYIAYNNGVANGDTAQNDLYVIDLVPSYDLSVSNAYIDEETMTVYAEVKNTGELNIDSYTISLLDGGINSQKTVTDGLKAGESAKVEIEYKKPVNLSKHSITFSVETVDSEVTGENAEYNTENNSAVLTVGNCDVEIADVQNHETMPDSVAVVTVTNKGYGDTGKVTVCLHKDSPDGAVMGTKNVDNLSAGESAEVMLDYNIVENDNIKWCVTAEAENTEISLGNNDSYIINNYYSTLSDYKHEILKYEIIEDKLLVNAYEENNTGADLMAVSLLAVFASDGELKAFAGNDICTLKNDSSSVDFVIENYTYEKGDFVKLFWWRDLNALAPVCEEKQLTLTKE